MLIAFFILVMVPPQPWPMLFGPYEEDECHAVFDFLNRRQYDLSSCTLLPLPQPDAVYVSLPFIP